MSLPKYRERRPEEILRLVTEAPFAWVVSGGGGAFQATPLPLRPRLGEDGVTIRALAGHFARANPQVGALRAEPRALVLFMGPHGYVSPTDAGDRTFAPTWNYASAQFHTEVTFLDEEPAARAILDDLAGMTEAGRPEPWAVEQMGERYGRLRPRIAPFEAEVLAAEGGFKLGQDERPEVFAKVIRALRSGGQAALADWMERLRGG